MFHPVTKTTSTCKDKFKIWNNLQSQEGKFFVSFISFFVFVFGHFWRRSYENTKILRNLCLHFARLDGQDWKKWKENHETKMTIIPKYVSIEWTKHKKLSTVQSGDFDEIFSHQLLQTMYIVGGGDDERRQPSHRAVFDI